MFGFKLITNEEYNKLKRNSDETLFLRRSLYGSLSFEQETEFLLRIGKGTQSLTFRKEDAEVIKNIGKKWMNEICWAYNNKPYEEKPLSALRVEGLEEWITSLVPIQHTNEKDEYDAVRMIDSKTGAVFAITRLKELESV